MEMSTKIELCPSCNVLSCFFFIFFLLTSSNCLCQLNFSEQFVKSLILSKQRINLQPIISVFGDSLQALIGGLEGYGDIVSVSCTSNEIFLLKGDRDIIRISSRPEGLSSLGLYNIANLSMCLVELDVCHTFGVGFMLVCICLLGKKKTTQPTNFSGIALFFFSPEDCVQSSDLSARLSLLSARVKALRN